MSAGDGMISNDSDPTLDGTMVGDMSKETKKAVSFYLNVRKPHKLQRPSICAEIDGTLDRARLNVCTSSMYNPADRVQTLINQIRDNDHQARHLFVEMDVLTPRGDNCMWREWARWVKYEEKVEDGGKRWSKPHVASLNMHYLLELRKHILEGVLLLDAQCVSISEVVDQFIDAWVANKTLEPVLRQHLRNLCLKHHRYRYANSRPDNKKKAAKRSAVTRESGKYLSPTHGGDMKIVPSAISLYSNMGGNNSELSLESMTDDTNRKANVRFLRKIPKGSEVANVMVAEVEELTSTVCGLMRLNKAGVIGDLTEVTLPTRFVFYLFGPQGSLQGNQESGRCLSTMFVDDVFREVVYKARNRNDVIAGIDEFLEQVTVLPPGEWDPKIRIEPPDKVADQEFRRISPKDSREDGVDHTGEAGHSDPDLVFSGRLFGGLIKDIKGKLPFYLSDFRDAFHIQCFASFIYIFLVTLTPNVTFGGLLGQETEQYLGVMECILAAAVTGIGFALFAGQPLNILGSTGPMLVLEKIIYQFCKDHQWDFLPFRFWIGIWTVGMLLLIVAFDLSVLVRYITRFTEEIFASLIALIFIYEAFIKLADIAKEDAPLRLHPNSQPPMPYCYCNYTSPAGWNVTLDASPHANMSVNAMNRSACLLQADSMNTTSDGSVAWVCSPVYYVPDVFLFSCILFVATFFVAIFLVDFRNWSCFPSFIRQMLSDFAVLIAILSMVGVDAALGLPTPKLIVPAEFKPTKSDARGWVVDPLKSDNPWWLALGAGVPALLTTILIFLDQQITAVIINRSDNKLVMYPHAMKQGCLTSSLLVSTGLSSSRTFLLSRRRTTVPSRDMSKGCGWSPSNMKGKGYHLDLLVLAILVAIHSLLGLPWYVAATVSAIGHINSLKKMSGCTAPGERPTFLGVREQRVTALLVGILSGAAVFITNILQFIPLPVLYGIFFFMGWSALRSMQLTDRFLLIFMPVKYQPDHIYLRHVPLWRVHVFTLIQITCLAGLWAVKQVKSISIIFPLLVLLTGVVRKLMECMYSQYELKYLDDLLPSTKRNTEGKFPHVSEDKASYSVKEDSLCQFVNKPPAIPLIGITRTDSFKEERKASFFLSDDYDSPPAYDNRGFNVKL